MSCNFSPDTQVILDVELLIHEVRKRPVLWDRLSVGYNNRIKKKICWEEIVQAVFDDWKDLERSEKRHRIETLKSKWRNLRDNYNKELVSQQKLKKGKIIFKRPYRFAEALSFLNNQFIRKKSKSSSESSNASEDERPLKRDNERPTKSGDEIKKMTPSFSEGSITNLDKTLFIEEVKKRPTLWNEQRRSADPNDRALRKKLWMEIAAVLIGNWDSLDRSNKSLMSDELKKKWHNIRDGLVRRRNKYRFYEELKFLEPQLLTRYEHDSDMEEVDIQLTEYEEETNEAQKIYEEPTETYEGLNSYRDQTQKIYEDLNTYEIQAGKTYQGTTEELKNYDEDVSFTEMLVPLLKKLTDDQKHFAQVEILNVLKKARSFDPLSNISHSSKSIFFIKDEN